MFYATPAQRADALMYLDSALVNAEFYAKNGLQQPTVEGLLLAAQRDASIRANLGTATKTAFAAAASVSLVGLSPMMVSWAFANPITANSVGIISAVGRIWGRAMQADAKISPVNYGGPLVDLYGRVLGVIVPADPRSEGETAGVEWYDSGIGFAVPLEDILAALPRLKEARRSSNARLRKQASALRRKLRD